MFTEVKKFLKETDLDLKVYYIGKKVRDLIAKEVNEGKDFGYSPLFVCSLVKD